MLEYIDVEIKEDINDPLVRRYWLGRCQHLLRSITDHTGKRMVFHVPEKNSRNKCSEYVLVAGDASLEELSAIGYRMRNNIAGIENSIAVIDDRHNEMEKTHRCIDLAMQKRWDK